ncbi:helix-turn-helix transcriptional regulator [Xanthomonas sp. WHRI 1810A]|uniref:helix-turn-helix domain-containing protein n=1 Tax=Xanthomonas sp. WHRI 1810A TaxID=3161565 RepID=UPI0032E9083C
MEGERLERLQNTHVIDGEVLGLTHREVEILKWCAAGKTAAEIGTILNLKCRTVNFHVGRAVHKMGVSNKTAAAVQAALSGIF